MPSSNIVIDANGTKNWYLNGRRHREGGPAIEYASGLKYWYYEGNPVNSPSLESDGFS